MAGPGQVVVDVAAASVNGADWRVRAGQYGEGKFPLILGRDFSGSVAAAAADVSDLKVGDPVFGVLEAGREGAYAEKLAIGAAIIARKPNALSHAEAAAVALTGLTAVISVETTLKLQTRRDHPDSGRRRRRRELRDPARQAYRRARDHHHQRRRISTMSAAWAPMKSSTTPRKTLSAWSKAATPSSTRSAARWQRNRLRCCGPGGAPPSSLPAPTAPKPERSDVTSLRPAVGALASAARAHRRTGRRWRGAPAGHRAVSAIASRRGASHQRRPSLPRQARLSGALAGADDFGWALIIQAEQSSL